MLPGKNQHPLANEHFLKASVFICVCLWPAYGAVDYTKFSHSTPKHKSACNTCHKPPTKNWTKTSSFPDVADFPDHDACVSCHRAQFFRGARPPICSVCHAKTSPRDEARYAFRNPATKLQFTIEFPHDRHQDVIASNAAKKPRAQFLHWPTRHRKTSTTAPSVTRNQPWPRIHRPAAGSTPTRHHSQHSKHHPPITHPVLVVTGNRRNPSPPTATAATNSQLPTSLLNTPTRISLKFMHEGGGEKKQHVAECTTCHINITKSATSRGLKPDVPITACTECHNKDGLRQDLNTGTNRTR